MNLDTTYTLFSEVLNKNTVDIISNFLSVNKNTVKKWIMNKKVPDVYFRDFNKILKNKYTPPYKETFRYNDQFYTTKEISKYCYIKMTKILKKLGIDIKEYTFIEPSSGCCNFYELLPKEKRIGIDIDPKGKFKNEIIKSDFLDYLPKEDKKYIIIGNPPFGLRGNLALRFINHANNFADIVAFILPPLFNSTGKGVPMKRVKGYTLAHSENLPLDSFEYPNGDKVEIATIFQIWTKINIQKIKIKKQKTCKTIMKLYSLSDGGTPSSTRNKKMLDKCDVYLPSTCFKGMKYYKSFNELPNRRGYGILFLKYKKKLKKIFTKDIDWDDVSFLSTNSAKNLRMDLIMNQIIQRGFYDK